MELFCPFMSIIGCLVSQVTNCSYYSNQVSESTNMSFHSHFQIPVIKNTWLIESGVSFLGEGGVISWEDTGALWGLAH